MNYRAFGRGLLELGGVALRQHTIEAMRPRPETQHLEPGAGCYRGTRSQKPLSRSLFLSRPPTPPPLQPEGRKQNAIEAMNGAEFMEQTLSVDWAFAKSIPPPPTLHPTLPAPPPKKLPPATPYDPYPKPHRRVVYIGREKCPKPTQRTTMASR